MLLPETLKYHNKVEFEFHYIYFLPWKNQMVEAIKNNGGVVSCFEASNNIQIFQKVPSLVRYIREQGINLVHCHLPWAGIAGRIAAKLTGVPVIYTEHNNFSRYHSLTKFASRLTISLNQLIIPVSRDAEVALKKFVSPEKIKLILNGVDTGSFRKTSEDAGFRSKLEIPADNLVVATAAVFREQKRLDNFLKVAEGVCSTNDKVSFIIVGDGPEKEKLKVLAEPLRSQGKVHFAGLQENVKPYFNMADVYLMTSDFEGLPIALLEAMSMSCAIVSTAVGGVPEVVENGVSGLLCDAGDVVALEKNVNLLLQDKEKRTTLAANARERVEQRFSMKNMVQKLEVVYKQYAKYGV